MKMKLFNILVLLPALCALAAKHGDSSNGVFEQFHAKSLSSAPLKLDDSLYNRLTNVPRDYTLAVVLTAMEARYGCTLCKEMQPEWDLVGKSWTKGDKKGESRVLFGTLDFVDGKATFQKLYLTTAPILLLFPPTVGPDAATDAQPIRHDFSQGPPTAEQIRDWISRHTTRQPHPPIVRPFNYLRIVTSSVAFVGFLTLISVTYPYLMPVIQSRKIWGAVSLLLILMFTSGHMFNHIRKVPYIAGDGKGGIAYFAGGFSNEFGIESQIIATIYGALAFLTIILSTKAPRIADASTQKLVVMVGIGGLYCVFGFLMSIFRVKNGGYPFRLPPL